MENLGFSLLAWVPGATAAYVLAQQSVLCVWAPGNCSLKLLVTYLFVCFITCMIALAYVPLQEYGSWRKEGIKKPLMGFMLAVKNVFSCENTVYGNLSHSLL